MPGEGEVVIRNYPGDRYEQALEAYTADATGLASQGYEVVSHSWAAYDTSGTTLGIGAWDRPSAGYLTVTYRLRSGPPTAQVGQPSLVERLRQLDEARRLGLITDDEYQAEKTHVMSNGA